MLSVLVAVAVAQPSPPAPSAAPADEVAVVAVAREGALAPELLARLETATRSALEEAKLPVQPQQRTRAALGSQSAADCQTNVTCFGLLGRSLGARVLVRLEASAVETDLAIFVQAIDTRELNAIAQLSLVTQTTASSETIAAQLAPFATKVRALAPSPAAGPPPVARRDEAAQPEQKRAPPAEVPAAPEAALETKQPEWVARPGRPLWPLAPAAIGVAAAGVGGVFVLQAHAEHERLTTPEPGAAPFTEAEREEIAARGRQSQLTGWTLIGVGAAALGAGVALYVAAEPEGTGEVAPVAAMIGPGGVAIGGSF